MSTEVEYDDLDTVKAELQAKKEAAKAEASEALESAGTVESEPTTEQESAEVDTEEAALAADEDQASETVESESTQHRSKAAEKRIAKLIKEREQLKGQLSLYQQSQQQEPTNRAVEYAVDPLMPNSANYTDEIEYKLDLREYQRNQQKKTLDFQTKIAEAAKADPTLQELMEDDVAEKKTLPPNQTTIELLKESDVSVELFRFLLANPDVANRIAQLNPTQTAKEIGKIEAKLEAKVKVTSPSTKKVVPLPPPITPTKVSKTAAPSKGKKYEEY